MTGGGEEDFLRILKHFHKKYRLTGIFPEGNKIDQYKLFVDEYLVIPNRMFPFTKFSIKSYSGFSFKGYKKYSLLKTFLKDKKFDLAYIHSSVCIYETLAINRSGIPYIISVREFINPEFVRNKMYRYYLKTAQKIIVISRLLYDEFNKLNYYSEKIKIIYPAIENPGIKLLIENDGKVLLNIGNIFPDKGQDKVIDAIAKIKLTHEDVILKIIGENVDDNYYVHLNDLIKKYGLENNVVFTGAVSKDTVLEEILKSTAVIISSSYEGFSLVALETLSCKKPLISTRVGVIPEILIDGENGLLYDFNDTDLLAGKIELLIKDKKLYDKLSENGFRTYGNLFNLEDSLNKIDSEFLSVLNQKKNL